MAPVPGLMVSVITRSPAATARPAGLVYVLTYAKFPPPTPIVAGALLTNAVSRLTTVSAVTLLVAHALPLLGSSSRYDD